MRNRISERSMKNKFQKNRNNPNKAIPELGI